MVAEEVAAAMELDYAIVGTEQVPMDQHRDQEDLVEEAGVADQAVGDLVAALEHGEVELVEEGRTLTTE